MEVDYIQNLSYEEKLVFIKLFCKVVRADGVVDADEIDFLKQIAQRYGLENSVVIDIIKQTAFVNVAAEAQKITNRRHALNLIKELCVLANIDDDLHDAELDVIIDAARAMGVDDNKIILINRWVLDSLILAKTGRIIMEENDE